MKSFRIMDVSYPGRFVPKMIRTQVGRFAPSDLDVSYPHSGRFVPKGRTFHTQGLDGRVKRAGRFVSNVFFFFFFFFLFLIFSVFDLVFWHPKL